MYIPPSPTALCLTGNAQDLSATIPRLFPNLLEPLGYADVFIVTPDLKRVSRAMASYFKCNGVETVGAMPKSQNQQQAQWVETVGAMPKSQNQQQAQQSSTSKTQSQSKDPDDHNRNLPLVENGVNVLDGLDQQQSDSESSDISQSDYDIYLKNLNSNNVRLEQKLDESQIQIDWDGYPHGFLELVELKNCRGRSRKYYRGMGKKLLEEKSQQNDNDKKFMNHQSSQSDSESTHPDFLQSPLYIPFRIFLGSSIQSSYFLEKFYDHYTYKMWRNILKTAFYVISGPVTSESSDSDGSVDEHDMKVQTMMNDKYTIGGVRQGMNALGGLSFRSVFEGAMEWEEKQKHGQYSEYKSSESDSDGKFASSSDSVNSESQSINDDDTRVSNYLPQGPENSELRDNIKRLQRLRQLNRNGAMLRRCSSNQGVQTKIGTKSNGAAALNQTSTIPCNGAWQHADYFQCGVLMEYFYDGKRRVDGSPRKEILESYSKDSEQNLKLQSYEEDPNNYFWTIDYPQYVGLGRLDLAWLIPHPQLFNDQEMRQIMAVKRSTKIGLKGGKRTIENLIMKGEDNDNSVDEDSESKSDSDSEKRTSQSQSISTKDKADTTKAQGQTVTNIISGLFPNNPKTKSELKFQGCLINSLPTGQTHGDMGGLADQYALCSQPYFQTLFFDRVKLLKEKSFLRFVFTIVPLWNLELHWLNVLLYRRVPVFRLEQLAFVKTCELNSQKITSQGSQSQSLSQSLSSSSSSSRDKYRILRAQCEWLPHEKGLGFWSKTQKGGITQDAMLKWELWGQMNQRIREFETNLHSEKMHNQILKITFPFQPIYGAVYDKFFNECLLHRPSPSQQNEGDLGPGSCAEHFVKPYYNRRKQKLEAIRNSGKINDIVAKSDSESETESDSESSRTRSLYLLQAQSAMTGDLRNYLANKYIYNFTDGRCTAEEYINVTTTKKSFKQPQQQQAPDFLKRCLSVTKTNGNPQLKMIDAESYNTDSSDSNSQQQQFYSQVTNSQISLEDGLVLKVDSDLTWWTSMAQVGDGLEGIEVHSTVADSESDSESSIKSEIKISDSKELSLTGENPLSINHSDSSTWLDVLAGIKFQDTCFISLLQRYTCADWLRW